MSFPRLGLPDESSEGEVSSHADGRCPQNFWFLATSSKAATNGTFICGAESLFSPTQGLFASVKKVWQIQFGDYRIVVSWFVMNSKQVCERVKGRQLAILRRDLALPQAWMFWRIWHSLNFSISFCWNRALFSILWYASQAFGENLGELLGSLTLPLRHIVLQPSYDAE